MCEDFHYSNDYKLNLLGSFVRDHLTKHLIDFDESCVSGSAISSLDTNEDKDRAFLKCKDGWISNFKNNASLDMEVKAR